MRHGINLDIIGFSKNQIKLIGGAEIEDLMHLFIAGKLPKEKWTHDAHLIAAIWHLINHGANTVDIMRTRIKRHNESVGTANSDSEGYHETITRFWLWAVEQFIVLNPSASIELLTNTLLESHIARKDYPLCYYSKARLFSLKARREWVSSDIQPMKKLI